MNKADLVVVGGGIVGLATAYQYALKRPADRVVVFEKEHAVGLHQTGHNSGVLHSGIYYKPGSLKAVNCRDGKRAMVEFCQQYGIEHEICGKVIVATCEDEIPRLEAILERGRANSVGCEMIGPERLAELEPHAAGVMGIHVPETGIVNYRKVAEKLGELLSAGSGELILDAGVRSIERRSSEIVVESAQTTVHTRWLVNCTGLQCDRVARKAGLEPEAKVVPFRGEYYDLKPAAEHLCRNLIYPVPDPKFPFLGVHFTRMIDGGVECGPNAVLAFAREGYRKRDINLGDLWESLTYAGFLRLAGKHWRMGSGEMWRSFSKAAFVRALQKLLPEIRAENLVAARAGVRAQAVRPDGTLVDDFLIQQDEQVIHVGNAPSPAATSSLNIGNTIVELVEATAEEEALD
jgi:L-2-hydroxyglutarate oxidase